MMNVEKFINVADNGDELRSVEVHYKPITFELELPDDAEQLTSAELNKLIIEQLQSNPDALLKNMEYSLLPKESLTPKNAYIGRLVRHVETNDYCVITKINSQLLNSALTVTYSNGSIKRGTFRDFALINENFEKVLQQFSFIQPKSLADLVNGGIYKFDTNILGVVRFNSKNLRASISHFSIENKRKVTRLGINELVECLFHRAPIPFK